MKQKKVNFSYMLIAFLYAFALFLIPETFLRDRNWYLIYATNPEEIFNRYLNNDGIISTLFNEPFFLGLNYILKQIVNPEIIPVLLSFFISFVLVFFMLREVKGFWLKFISLLYLTFIPFCFHLQLVILRQGLPVAIFLIVMMLSKKERTPIIATFILGFIHSSFFIVFLFMLILYFIKNIKYSSQIIIITIVSILFSASSFFVGKLLGFRQVDLYKDAIRSGSGLSFLLYSGLLCLILTRGEGFLKSYRYYSVAIVGLTVYLSLYFVSPFAGRLIASFMPFIICSLLRTNKLISYVVIILFLLLNLFTFKDAVLSNSLTEEARFFL